MPKITAARITLTALVLLGLTGCSGISEEPRSEAESDFLSTISGVDRSAAELLEGAHAACEQIENRRSILQVRVFEDDTNEYGFYSDSVRVAFAAVSTICP